MSRYFQVTTDRETKLPTSIREFSSSAARSFADKGPAWFLLRTGPDEPAPVGFHACALTRNQQQQLEAYRRTTPGCPLPADWNDDYPNEAAAAARRFSGSGSGVPLKSRLPQPPTRGGAGDYIKAR